MDLNEIGKLVDDLWDGDPQLPGIAFAVGRVCQAWSDLEVNTTALLGVLSQLPRTETSLAILRCFAITEQFAAIKVAAAGTLRGRPIASEIIEAVDYVDNTLRPRRDLNWPHERQRFFIRPGSRKRPWKFFDGADVPYFEGDCAWFEIERKQGCWRFLRQVTR